MGLRKRRWTQIWDSESLQEDVTDQLTYTDDEDFDPKVNYNLGLRKFDDADCYYMKQSDDYDLHGTHCQKEKQFFCLWKAYQCPQGYHYLSQLSNGRTCHASPATSKGPFEEATCDTTGDKALRSPWMPKNAYEMDLFRRKFL